MGNSHSSTGYSRLQQGNNAIPNNNKVLPQPVLVHQNPITSHERMLEELKKRVDILQSDCGQLRSSMKKQEQIMGLIKKGNEELLRRVMELTSMVTNQQNSYNNNQHIVAESTPGVGASDLNNVPDLIDLDPIPYTIQNGIDAGLELIDPINSGNAMQVAPVHRNLAQVIDSIDVLVGCIVVLIFVVGILAGLIVG